MALSTFTVARPLVLNLRRLEPLAARRPRWAESALQARDCPLCRQANEPQFLRPDDLPVARCSRCSLWYASRTPDSQALAEFYADYWRAFRPEDLSDRAGRRILSEALELARQDLRLQRLQALDGLRGKRLLDVGCGRGSLMAAAAALGARVAGVDLAAESCAFVRDQLGYPVYHGQLQDAGLSDACMDVILMADLLEHVLDADSLLREAARVLAPGGLLLCWTPNGGAADADSDWVGFRVDLEHMQYFSCRSLLYCGDTYGYTVEHLETLGFPHLDGSGASTAEGPDRRSTWRQWLRQVPGAQRGYKALRRLRAPAVGSSERDGTYHLFAILRKERR